MSMRNIYIKSAFAAAMGLLLCGTTASADEAEAVVKMTYIDGSAARQSFGEVESVDIGYLKVSGDSLALANKGWNANKVAYLQVDASAVEGNIIKAELNASVTRSTDNKRTANYHVGYNSSAWSSTLTWDTADKTITVVGDKVSVPRTTRSTTGTFDVTKAFEGDADKVVTLIVYCDNAAGGTFSNPTVTITYAGADTKTADYKVKFVDGEGNELKAAETRNTIVGEKVGATESDLATFYSEDKAHKYVYESGNDSVEVADDGSSEINLVFTDYTKYTASVNLVAGDTTIVKTAEDYADTDINVYYPAYVQDSKGEWYTIDPNSEEPTYGKVFSPGSTSETVNYVKADNVIYYAEYEDICSKHYGNFNGSQASLGSATVLSGDGASATTKMNIAKSGNFDVTIKGFCRKGTKVLNVYLDTDKENPVFTSDEIDGTMQEINFNVDIPAGANLYIVNGSGNDTFVGDYIVVKGDPSSIVTSIKNINNSETNVNAAVYNLAGQRVCKSYKGIVIVNGKKAIRK